MSRYRSTMGADHEPVQNISFSFSMKTYSLLVALSLLSIAPLSLAEDIPGSKDPMGLKRYEGTRTTFYEEQAFGTYTLPLGKVTRTKSGFSYVKSKKLEGKTTLLHLSGKRWLAAARESAMDLFSSEDDGVTWGEPNRVTQKNEINGHLARLTDGRIILAYGNRIKAGNQYGVLAKFSSDEGKTWDEPIRIALTKTNDCGYPSTVQRADGKLVTAWYSGTSEYHTRYHMGVAIWEAPQP